MCKRDSLQPSLAIVYCLRLYSTHVLDNKQYIVPLDCVTRPITSGSFSLSFVRIGMLLSPSGIRSPIETSTVILQVHDCLEGNLKERYNYICAIIKNRSTDENNHTNFFQYTI